MAANLKVDGWYNNTINWLKRLESGRVLDSLDRFGEMGVEALRQNTPKESGLTSASWDYTITRGKGSVQIVWFNTNVVSGEPIAILLQYGHGTGTGGYVEGQDYINPSMQPVFAAIMEAMRKEVSL